MCQSLTRRQLLGLVAFAAATPVAARTWRPARAYSAVDSHAVPLNLELVTVTDTSATFTWLTGDPASPDEYGRPEPIPADTVLEIGTDPANLQRVVDRDTGTPFHYVEVTGLEPGRPYFYRALSNGLPAAPAYAGPQVGPAATGTFQTLTPPPGALLFTMAWANDLHIGEGTSGLAYSDARLPGGGFPPGFAADPADPYWRFMASAAVAESRTRGAELLLLNGDLTSDSKPEEIAECRRILDGFGTYADDWFVTRGNHDLPTGPGQDPIADEFFPRRDSWFSFDRRGVRFLGLDTNDPSGQGAIADEQFAWLEAELERHDGTPMFVMGHHPISEEAVATSVPPGIFGVNAQDATRFEQLIANRSVIGVYGAHTHRNRRTSSPFAPGIPFVELGAVKEYPGGFGLVRVYEGGYMVNFHKTQADPARAWSERSRGEYLGLYPWYTLGALGDRNFVVTTDVA